MTKPVTIVAIDGPVGVGKSSVAAGVARRLSLPHLETGGMYRGLALEAIERAVDPQDAAAVAALLPQLDLVASPGDGGGVRILRNGAPLGPRAQLPEVSEVTSQVASIPAVRVWMVERQREFGERQGAVLEGRDIGTHVFPGTPYKFYLDAPVEVRAQRRFDQLPDAGERTLDRLIEQIRQRDERDMNRAESPLRCDDTYVKVDTSDLTLDDVVDRLVAEVERLRSSAGS